MSLAHKVFVTCLPHPPPGSESTLIVSLGDVEADVEVVKAGPTPQPRERLHGVYRMPSEGSQQVERRLGASKDGLQEKSLLTF